MTLKQKIQNRELTIGSWITIGNPIIAEIMAQAGFEWLTIDMEHSAITLDIAQDLIRVIGCYNVEPLVRVGFNDPTVIKRVMDAGAKGVIVPMVNSKEDAENAVSAVKYPPVGFRGVGLARAQKYGADFEGYKKWNQNDSIVIVQIEHINAVNNFEEIMNVEGVDGFIIGPYDLSASLGFPGKFDHPDVVDALKRVELFSKSMNVVSGVHVIQPDENIVKHNVELGYRFIAHSIDILFFGNSCREYCIKCKELIS